MTVTEKLAEIRKDLTAVYSPMVDFDQWRDDVQKLCDVVEAAEPACYELNYLKPYNEETKNLDEALKRLVKR